jgi:hypothetical protein
MTVIVTMAIIILAFVACSDHDPGAEVRVRRLHGNNPLNSLHPADLDRSRHRRQALHDRDKSAWWLLVFYALPGILSSAGNQMDDVAFLILHVVSFAITVWAFVELGCLRGTRGPNRFGPDPLSAPT